MSIRAVTICQINGCTNEAHVELVLAPDAAVWVCHLCAQDPNTRAALEDSNAGVYEYEGRRVVLACEGEPPPTHVPASSDEVVEVYLAAPWEPYLLPCLKCREKFVFDWSARASLFCPECGLDDQAPEPVRGQPAPEPPSVEEIIAAVPEQHRDYAREHYEERAAIAEFHANMPREEAERSAQLQLFEGCQEAGWC